MQKEEPTAGTVLASGPFWVHNETPLWGHLTAHYPPNGSLTFRNITMFGPPNSGEDKTNIPLLAEILGLHVSYHTLLLSVWANQDPAPSGRVAPTVLELSVSQQLKDLKKALCWSSSQYLWESSHLNRTPLKDRLRVSRPYTCGHVSKQDEQVKSTLRNASDKNTPRTNSDTDCTRHPTGIRDVETHPTGIFVRKAGLGGRIPSCL